MQPKIFQFLKTASSTYKSHFNTRPVFPKISKPARQKTYFGTAIATMFAYGTYHFSPSRTKIKLLYEETPENNEIISKLTHLYENHFKPSFFLTFPLLQAIMGKAPPEGTVQYIREYVKLPDGGQLALDWSLPKFPASWNPQTENYISYEPPKENKILFLLHGLTGGSDSGYMKMMVEVANRKGYRVVVMNHRGINQPLLTPFPYHGGKLEDIDYAVKHVQTRYPNAPMLAVGLSLGGNQMFRYFAEYKDQHPFLAGAGLGVPFDINDCVEAIKDGIYEKFFLKRYLEMNVSPHVEVFRKDQGKFGIDMDEVFKAKTLREFHEKFSCKIYNYKDSSEFFSTTKILEDHIKNINKPFLLIHAKDDPISVHHSIPTSILAKNSKIIYAETAHGGHLGWFSGMKPRRWYADPTIQFLETMLEYNEKRGSSTYASDWQENINQSVEMFQTLCFHDGRTYDIYF